MVELIGSFPFFLNLLAYPSALLEGAKQLLWPLSIGKHFPSAFLSPQLGHQLSYKHNRLLPQGAWKLMTCSEPGSIQFDEDAENCYWLISRETPHGRLWVDIARSRACREQSIILEILWAHLSAISCLSWPGEGMQSPTHERQENGPDGDRSLVIVSLVKFHSQSIAWYRGAWGRRCAACLSTCWDELCPWHGTWPPIPWDLWM